MVSDKLIVSTLLLGWRAVRVLTLLLFGGRSRAITTESGLSVSARPSHRSSFRSGLTWTMVLALIVIGIPLANSDRAFKERAGRDVEVIAQLLAEGLPQPQ